MGLYIAKSKTPTAETFPLRHVSWLDDMGLAPSGVPLVEYLSKAVYLSTPITHAEGNRRYNNLLLTIRQGRLEKLAEFIPECHSCQDTKVFQMGDDVWPCPDCKPKRPKRKSRR